MLTREFGFEVPPRTKRVVSFSGPLQRVADDGKNGVYGSSAGTFPTGSLRSNNHRVDAVVQ